MSSVVNNAASGLHRAAVWGLIEIDDSGARAGVFPVQAFHSRDDGFAVRRNGNEAQLEHLALQVLPSAARKALDSALYRAKADGNGGNEAVLHGVPGFVSAILQDAWLCHLRDDGSEGQALRGGLTEKGATHGLGVAVIQQQRDVFCRLDAAAEDDVPSAVNGRCGGPAFQKALVLLQALGNDHAVGSMHASWD